jgi:hypothetical protein
MPMIIGKISENEKKIRYYVDIHCTNCNKSVPGRVATGQKYSQTKEFKVELENYKKDYLCGICRDKRRVNKA